MTLPDPVQRALRTFVQTAIGVFLALVVGPHWAPGQVPDVATLKAAFLAAVFAGVVAILSYAQNALENAGVVPAVLKEPAAPITQPSPPAAPTGPPR